MNSYDENSYDEDYPQGDARCCPRHPWVRTSDPDGLFDAPCGCCEYETETGERVTGHERAGAAPSQSPTVPPRVGAPSVPADDDDILF